MADLVTDDFAETIVNTARVTVGDSLRSVVYFTPDDFELLYVRADLYAGDEDAVREAKGAFVENERVGFADVETYESLATEPNVEPDIGEYEFTVRVFSDGFVSRVIVGDRGVLVTSDGIEMDPFEEMAIALRKTLADPSIA
ncbi:DUF7522 family protein [Salinilacihabitans rarus]|uniref:DUF7522 family protein n=1 Tax=Salinilacihabitans rarus TaxID=2961596 RepID=UPI0020C8CF47|nr:hypothetical protein [Salinilacihabitans rarus]